MANNKNNPENDHEQVGLLSAIENDSQGDKIIGDRWKQVVDAHCFPDMILAISPNRKVTVPKEAKEIYSKVVSRETGEPLIVMLVAWISDNEATCKDERKNSTVMGVTIGKFLTSLAKKGPNHYLHWHTAGVKFVFVEVPASEDKKGRERDIKEAVKRIDEWPSQMLNKDRNTFILYKLSEPQSG